MYLSRNTVSSSPSMTDPYSPGSPDMSAPPPQLEGVPLEMAKPPPQNKVPSDAAAEDEPRSNYVPDAMDRHLRAMAFDRGEGCSVHLM